MFIVKRKGQAEEYFFTKCFKAEVREEMRYDHNGAKYALSFHLFLFVIDRVCEIREGVLGI